MALTIQLPERSQLLASNRERWTELMDDQSLAPLVGKIETNAYGQWLRSPPPSRFHGNRQSRILQRLVECLAGRSLSECPISTADGVKAADVVWFSDDRYASLSESPVCDLAGEICVEVLSPSNGEAEMSLKRRLYFDAGAIECWQCDTEGKMTFCEASSPDQARPTSSLCPDFPTRIED